MPLLLCLSVAGACTLDGIVGQVGEDSADSARETSTTAAATLGLADSETTDTGATTGVESSTGGGSGGEATTSTTSDPTTGTSSGTSTSTGSTSEGFRPETTGEGDTCPFADPPPCDDTETSVQAALGIGCSHGLIPDAFSVQGPDGSLAVLEGNMAGPDSPFTPREGIRAVVLSTGHAQRLTMSRAQLIEAGHCVDTEPCPSFNHMYTQSTLPEPINPTPIELPSCADDPQQVGTGDCSATIFAQWAKGENGLAFDYTELRFSAEVPLRVDRLSFDYTFFTAEYPTRFQQGFNDLFFVWLDSERYTGNIAVDEGLVPISASETRFDHRDAAVPDICPEPCEAPELHGTSMEGHAATNWRTNTTPALPGESLTLVFGLFDVGDGEVDSVVLLDNVHWGCAIPE